MVLYIMRNQEIAAIFNEIADILDAKGVQWEPIAYRKAARSLESLPQPIEDIYAKGGKKALMEIEGIGKAMSYHIEEILKTNKLKKIQDLKAKIPKGVLQMMQIEGLGPKKAMILYKKLKVKSLKDLKKAIKDKKIRKLEGFGAKSEENITANVQMYEKGHERISLGAALPVAESIVEKLKKLKEVDKVMIGGSARRGRETVGDIDILVASNKPGKVMDVFTTLPIVERVLGKGPTKSTVVLRNNLQVDVRIIKKETWGGAAQYFTGNVGHNVVMRKIAIAKGWKLSEYGLINKKTGRMVASKTEKDVYGKLGLQLPPPEIRENSGEIELAKKHRLPKLVDMKDIRGDLHTHTRWSDGNSSIEDMISAAQKMGYEYIAITDHSKSDTIAHGMNEKRLEQYIAEVRKIARKYRKIHVFVGSEVYIHQDGSLDYADNVLKKLDIVVASIHRAFKMPRDKMTERITNMLENKNVDIFGHPTTRLVNVRAPIDFDTKHIFDVAADRGVVMEVDGGPERLDLKDTHVREAISAGCKISIDSDAHSTSQLSNMKYGVITARRGWATPKDVVNTYSFKDLKRILH
jgi:DNA polymerase (family 10)